MTYASFLALFVGLPLVVMWVAWRPRVPVVLLLIVYAAATPWDNLAAGSGLWTFAPDKIGGLRLWHLPIEEYAFFGLQTLLTGGWVARRLSTRQGAGA